MLNDQNYQQKPENPKLRVWGKVSGVVAFAIYTAAKYGYDLSIEDSLMYAALPAVPLLFALFILFKEEKRYELQLLEWRVSNQKAWIAYHQKALDEGQPWFDNDDPEEWVFEHKRAIANAKDRIIDLEAQLEQ